MHFPEEHLPHPLTVSGPERQGERRWGSRVRVREKQRGDCPWAHPTHRGPGLPQPLSTCPQVHAALSLKPCHPLPRAARPVSLSCAWWARSLSFAKCRRAGLSTGHGPRGGRDGRVGSWNAAIRWVFLPGHRGSFPPASALTVPERPHRHPHCGAGPAPSPWRRPGRASPPTDESLQVPRGPGASTNAPLLPVAQLNPTGPGTGLAASGPS